MWLACTCLLPCALGTRYGSERGLANYRCAAALLLRLAEALATAGELWTAFMGTGLDAQGIAAVWIVPPAKLRPAFGGAVWAPWQVLRLD